MEKKVYNAFNMPSPRWLSSYPAAPYHFKNREYLIITYRTHRELLEPLIPKPLELIEPIVKFEFIKMPDSSGFGDYTESGQVVPVVCDGEQGGFTLSMFLDNQSPIAGGREIWGFPKKLAKPKLFVDTDTLVGFLDYGAVRVATATMGYKHEVIDSNLILNSLKEPVFLLKNIPGVDGKPLVNQLTRTYLENITVKGSWQGPGALSLYPHALAPVANLPVLEVLSTVHFISDLTLPYGEVLKDYLNP